MKRFKNHEQKRNFIEEFIRQPLADLGYQCAYLELQLQRFPKLVIAIEKTNEPTAETETNNPVAPIGIEDCVAVSQKLDLLLDESLEVQELFPDSYTLEVSSPGVERPLVREADYQKFTGKKAKVQLFRPLQAQEIESMEPPISKDWYALHAKQKTFSVILEGFDNGKARVRTPAPESAALMIPLELIAKAYLTPDEEALNHLLAAHSKKERHRS